MTVKTRPLPSFEHYPCCRVVKNTSQALAPNTAHTAVWNYVEHETPAGNIPYPMWDGGGTLYARTPGVYSCVGNANFSGGFGGFRLIYLVKNSVDVKSIVNISFGANGFYHAETVNADVLMAAGDYMQLWVYHSFAGTLYLDPISIMSFSLRLVYPTTYIDYGS